jgi:hypothetical protein
MLKPDTRSDEILEYDVYVRMPIKEAHLLGYMSEAYDNVMNIRHAEAEDGTLKIIVPADLFDEVMTMLDLLKEEINLEVVKYGPNPGHP